MFDDDFNKFINDIQNKYQESIAKLYSKDRLWQSPLDFEFEIYEWKLDRKRSWNGEPTNFVAPAIEEGATLLTILRRLCCGGALSEKISFIPMYSTVYERFRSVCAQMEAWLTHF